MQVTATDNFGKSFKLSKLPVATLSVPVGGIVLPVPLDFDYRAGETDDLIDEKAIEDEFSDQIDALMGKLAQEVKDALNAALRSSVWAWNNGVRDIYDTGELASSGEVSAGSDGIIVSYSAPYANLVHNGGYIHPYGNEKARPVYLPARPWVSSVLYGGGPVPQFDFEKFLKSNLG